jgi:hypothetical protein
VLARTAFPRCFNSSEKSFSDINNADQGKILKNERERRY